MTPLASLLRPAAPFLLAALGFAAVRAEAPPGPPAPPPESPPSAAPAAVDPNLPTIFIAGDSTAARDGGDVVGWGVPFAAYFDPAKVNVVNLARGGRSSRTFITEGLWDKLLAQVKPGDYVLIQFGHNDGGSINQPPPGSKEPLRARGSLPGLGGEAQEIDNVVTKKHEVVHTFGWYMRRMIEEARNKGAAPIVLSLTVRNNWKDGKVERGPGEFSKWSEEVAQQENVAFVDLTAIIAGHYEEMGEAAVGRLFPKDHTHTNAEGADLNAGWVVAGLKALPRSPFARWLSARGEAVAAAPAERVHSDFLAWLNLPTPADPKLPTLFLVGDSTVRNGRGDGAGGQWGWGDCLAPYFDTARINVVNRAVGGTSSRSFISAGYWDRVLAMLKPGDFVLMQFGHNDGGALNDKSRARGTIKGVGEETQEIDNELTHQHEVVHTYGWYLRKFIADTRAKGATPVVCTLIPRKTWKDGKIVRSQNDYAGWAVQVAAAEHVPLVDLNEIIARQYDELGPEKVDPLFADPHTHTSLAGALRNAASVIAGLKGLPVDPLAPYLSPQAAEVKAYQP